MSRDSSKPETFLPSAPPPSVPESANALPLGSGLNTAGAHGDKDLSLKDAVKTVRWQDFLQVHMYPCVRESFLTGIGGGFGIGALRAVFGAPIPKAANWAVGTFLIASLANYEYCCTKRTLEKAQMKKVVEVLDLKKAEKEREMERKREERRRRREEHELEKEGRARSSWRFW